MTLNTAPLPMRNGVTASYLWLQKGPWKTLIEFLNHRFPEVGDAAWRDRLLRGDVVDDNAQVLTAAHPYFWGQRIFYYRELDDEPMLPFHEQILFQDDDLLVVDKPHFMSVIPGGRFLHQTLLVRLKNSLGLPDLSPIHRLDRETAGVMLFSINPANRGAYQSLFQQRSVHKEYQALAPHLDSYCGPFTYRSRMAPGTPFFRMCETVGPANSATSIDIIERLGTISRYRLQPLTGRKHQLRVHLAGLGVPILHDLFYPDVFPVAADNFAQPLKLLAQSIAFEDPVTGQARYFESKQRLELALNVEPTADTLAPNSV